MPQRRIGGAALKELRTLFQVGVVGPLTDGQLLERFSNSQGEAAECVFEVLVDRHGPMVLGACRRILNDRHAADDAFQATFLVLARRAGSLQHVDSLAAWLHRVAKRIAWRSRAQAARRQQREGASLDTLLETREVVVSSDPGLGFDLERAELRAILDEEIHRLRSSQRLPIILCDLEGLSHEQAAARLDWPVGAPEPPRSPYGDRRELSPHDLVILAEGHGLVWERLTPRNQTVPLMIQLPTEATVRGQVVDPDGQPIAEAGVKVHDIAHLGHGSKTLDGRRGHEADADPCRIGRRTI